MNEPFFSQNADEVFKFEHLRGNASATVFFYLLNDIQSVTKLYFHLPSVKKSQRKEISIKLRNLIVTLRKELSQPLKTFLEIAI